MLFLPLVPEGQDTHAMHFTGLLQPIWRRTWLVVTCNLWLKLGLICGMLCLVVTVLVSQVTVQSSSFAINFCCPFARFLMPVSWSSSSISVLKTINKENVDNMIWLLKWRFFWIDTTSKRMVQLGATHVILLPSRRQLLSRTCNMCTRRSVSTSAPNVIIWPRGGTIWNHKENQNATK
jgi:hypothetical protein